MAPSCCDACSKARKLMSKNASPFIMRNRGSSASRAIVNAPAVPSGTCFAQHPDRRLADPAPVVGRLKNLSEIAAEQEDVVIAVAFDHLEQIVEERPVARDRQHRLRNGLA